MTHDRKAVILGVVVALALVASTIGSLSDSKLGTAAWLIGLLVLTVVCPIWGFSLGRIDTGRGHLRERWRL